MSTDLIDYLSVIRKLNEKYSAMIPDKDYWNGRSVGEFFVEYRTEIVSMLIEYPKIDIDGVDCPAWLTEDDMPFEKELLQAKLYKFLIDPSIFLLPRYVMRMFRQIFGISLRKGSLGDGLAALSENGLFVEFKLCSANKLPQWITEAADSSETFFICVYDFPPETIRKLRSGRLKVTVEEGKKGYIFDLARRELYKLTKNKKVTLDLLDLLPAMSWGGTD